MIIRCLIIIHKNSCEVDVGVGHREVVHERHDGFDRPFLWWGFWHTGLGLGGLVRV